MQSTNFNRDDMQSIRHPDGHGIDCRINERRGEIEIIRGKRYGAAQLSAVKAEDYASLLLAAQAIGNEVGADG